MSSSRTALRSARCVRTRTIIRNNGRQFLSTNQSAANSSNGGGFSPILVGSLTGSVITLSAVYGWYHFSGTKSIVDTAYKAKASLNQASKSFQDSTPDLKQAVPWLRRIVSSYAATIPGAKGVTDSFLDDIEGIYGKHGEQLDQIIGDAQKEITGLIKDKGMTEETARKAWTIIEKSTKQIADIAGKSAHEVLDNHPEIKEKIGGNMDQLKALGEKYGPEAKKQVDQAWEQVQDIMKSGFSLESAAKARSLIKDTTAKVQQIGDQAWDKGMEQAKPFLDGSPKIKALLEKNIDALKQGNVRELWSTVKKASESGKTDAVEQFIQSAATSAQSASSNSSSGREQQPGGQWQQIIQLIPGTSQIVPQLLQVLQAGKQHGKEAEDLAKSTLDEIQQLLRRKVAEAEKLAGKVKEDGEKKRK